MGCDQSAMLRWPRFGIRRKDWEREMAGGVGRGGCGLKLWQGGIGGVEWRVQ